MLQGEKMTTRKARTWKASSGSDVTLGDVQESVISLEAAVKDLAREVKIAREETNTRLQAFEKINDGFRSDIRWMFGLGIVICLAILGFASGVIPTI